jgi:hypothetical protein
MMMELVGPGRMKTGPVLENNNGPDQIKKWPSGNQQISETSNKCASQMRTGGLESKECTSQLQMQWHGQSLAECPLKNSKKF